MTFSAYPPELSFAGLTALGAGNSCDREPIRFSGAIQPHGFLLGVDPGTVRICVASDNVKAFTDVTADAALGAPLSAVIGAEGALQVAGLVTLREFDSVNPVTVVLAPLRHGPSTAHHQMVVHRSSGLLILEFEPILDSGADLAAVHTTMRRMIVQPPDTDGAAELCDTAVRQLRQLTGYDRVMAYRFDTDAHGEVIAEACLPKQEPFLGLHYPAGDIPRQARLLYFRNRLRVVMDVGYQPVPLRCAAGAPADLDLGQSILRSVSPVHLEYLRNMDVAATMTISLIVDDQLWGMLACHHGGPKQPSYYIRLAAETLGQMLALQLRTLQTRQRHDRLDELGRLSAQVVTAMAAGEHLARAASSVPSALLGMVGADGAVLQIGGERVVTGRVPAPVVLDRLIAEMAGRAGPTPLATDGLSALLPGEAGAGANGEAGEVAGDGEPGRPGNADVEPGPDAAGALYVSLDSRGSDCVMWLRGERAASVRWAGAPTSGSPADRDRGHISPRSSFAEWLETVGGRSRPWLGEEVTIAADFAAAMPELLLHRTQNRLVQLALHDALTGLANRALLRDRLQAMADQTASHLNRNALLFVDLDRFKSVNDTLGHQAGDTLLVDAARRLRAAVRPGDTVARLGGDEFVVALADLAAPDDGFIVAQRILRSFQITFPLTSEVAQVVTVSIGLAEVVGPFVPEELLRQADKALYSAKRDGRNRIAVFDKAPSDLQAEAAETERELALAIANDELVVHYQAIVSAATPWTGGGPEEWLGVEALVRWQHPRRGLLAPDHFIHLAEATGQIRDIGAYVLSVVLRQVPLWELPHLYVTVNVSATELAGPGYATSVLDRLSAAGVAPERLRLEVTETQVMDQPEVVAAVLAELEAAGVRIAIDDFGTGFATLSYVRNLPATILKIDRSFISGLPGNPRDLALVASAIHLAHELGLSAIAEGVETLEQLTCLQELGCDSAQGFFISRPVPPEEIDHLLRPRVIVLDAGL